MSAGRLLANGHLRKCKALFVFLMAICLLWTYANPVRASELGGNMNVQTESGNSFLTVDGKANSQIVLSGNASAKELYAAGELQQHFHLVSGADVPILMEPDGAATLSASLNKTSISASQIGYYPFTLTVTNFADTDVEVTATPSAASSNAPIIELGADTVTIPGNSYVEIDGLVEIDGETTIGKHVAQIEISDGAGWNQLLSLDIEFGPYNFLRNADIEASSFFPWWQTADFYPDDTVAHSGNKSIRITGTDTSSGYNTALVFRTSYAYELSFWAKRDAATEVGIRMIFTELDQANAALGRSEKSFQISDDWRQYRMIVYNNINENPLYDKSWLNIFLEGTGTVWLDDFMIREIGQVEVAERPDYGPNMIRNGSFESDSAWFYESGSSRIEYGDAIDGDYVLFVDMAAKENGRHHPYQSTLNLEKNHVFQLGFDAKRSGENADGAIEFVLTALPKDTIGESVVMEVTPTTEWMRYEMKFVSTSHDELTGYWPDLFVPGTTGELYIDNITLFDLGEAEGPIDSTITSSPSQKTYWIVFPDMGEKPELDYTVTALNEWNIWIATPDSEPALASQFADDLAFIGDSDGFAVRADGKTIYIFGTNDDGALNGVYDFIEQNLGVLWTRSIELGTLYDPMPTIPLTKVDYREKSPFAIRGWHLTGFGANGEPHSDPATEIMMSRNKLNAKFAEIGAGDWNWQKSIGLEPVNLGHNLQSWLLASPTYKSLPAEKQAEFWNTDNDGNPVFDRGQLNFWHPELPGLIAESLDLFLNEQDIRYIGVGMEDTWYTTQKPEDTLPFEYEPGKFVQPDDPKYLSTVFFAFINEVARLVKVNHPDVTVTTYAYLFTETPPYGEIEDNVAIMIAPINEDMKLPITAPESLQNSPIMANMLEWTQKTDKIIVYNYYGCFPFASDWFERPIAPRMQADFRFYADNGFLGLLPEGIVDNNNDMWAVSALTMWLYSKLAWNPDADIQELVEWFSQKAYGDAAEAMIEYYGLLQEAWDENYAPIKWNTPLSVYVQTFYSDENRNALMQAALNRAWSLANDRQKQRIAPIKAAFEANVGIIEEEGEVAEAKKTDAGREAVMADLDMNGPIWGQAKVLSNFLNAENMQPYPGTRTNVRLLWDEEHLYVAYENFDEGIHDLKMAPAAGNWWQGDSDDVETYISATNPQGDPAATFRVYFSNPLGEQLVYREGVTFVQDPGTWYTSAQVVDEDGTENDRWIIIKGIPFEHLGITGPATKDTQIYGYFYRGHYSPDGFVNIGWEGASVWQPLFFKPITLIDDEEDGDGDGGDGDGGDGDGGDGDGGDGDGGNVIVLPPDLFPGNQDDAGDQEGVNEEGTDTDHEENEANVLVNGRQLPSGSVSSEPIDGRQVTRIALDSDAIGAELTEEDAAVVTITATDDSDVVVAALSGALLKQLAGSGAVIELVTSNGSYRIPLQHLVVDEFVSALDADVSLEQVKLEIEISVPSPEQEQWVEDAANNGNFTFVAQPLNFVVRGVFGERTVEIAEFAAYVERSIKIPADIDPADVSTAVVVDADGSVRHVPTKVVASDDGYIAVIQSMTNSLYGLISNSVQFRDTANHWAADAIHDMGARLIVNGVDGESFQPDRPITRAEFVAILTRALGLQAKEKRYAFADVDDAAWYSEAVHTANAYQMIEGYEDHTFRPSNEITREEAMTIIARAMELTGLTDVIDGQPAERLAAFRDAGQIADWARTGVSLNLQAGIIEGRSATTLAPKANITRAEVAVAVRRLLQQSNLI